MAHRDKVLAWLNNAYIMETKLVHLLESQLDDAKDFPKVEAKTKEHLEATKKHAQIVKSHIEKLGGTPAEITSNLSALMGKFEGALMEFMEDKVVRNSVTNYAAEHLEIASYTALITAFQEINEDPSDLEGILKEEKEMATWLENNTPSLVKEYLTHLHNHSNSD